MKRGFVSKYLLLVTLFSVLSFGIGGALPKATSMAWDGHWSNHKSIPYVNNVTGNTLLKSLVNTAALNNINNYQTIVKYVQSNNATGRHVLVKDINLPSVTWTGKAEGASYNWDSNKHYYRVTVQLNVGKGITKYSDSKLKGLIAHELGHALGLQHWENFDNFLMYPYDTRTQYTPNSAEANVLYYHYYHQM